MKQVGQNGSGSAQPQLPISALRYISYPKPKVATQKKIAAVLSALDAKIELNNRINAELEAMAKTLYETWFVQFDFPYDFAQGRPDTNGQPYKSSGGKMVYNEKLKRDIPEGWAVGSIGDGLSVRRGISYKKADIQESGVPLINLNSFALTGRFKPEGMKFFSGKFKASSFHQPGDLAVAITDVTRNADIIGRGFVIPEHCGNDLLISCDVASITSDKLNNHYLEMLFNSQPYHDFIKHFASGTLVLHLDINGIKWFQSVFPPQQLLDRFAVIREGIAKQVSINVEQNQRLTSLRDFLLPMLMNGQVQVG